MSDKFDIVSFKKLEKGDADGIERMSSVATAIVREYYDPILGTAQNDYMLEMFQSVRAIKEQLDRGVSYYFVEGDGKIIGFFAFYPKKDCLYLSKFYLEAPARGRGAGKRALEFIKGEAAGAGKDSIELNVNRNNIDTIGFYEATGFRRIRSEKNDIGNGFFMDDHVYGLKI